MRFNANAETLKLTAGLGFFVSPIIMGKSNPTDDELLADDEKFRAMCLIQSAEPGHYGDLIDRLKKNMDLGQDDYPETVADAYELLNRTTNEITATGCGNQGNRGGHRVQFVQQ